MLVFISLKTIKLYQIDKILSSKVYFYDIFKSRAENIRALCVQWSSSLPLPTLQIVSMPM